MLGAIEKTIISCLVLSSNLYLAAAYSPITASNPLGIDYDPAPSPEDGPPLSAGALRNKSYLPAEIGGIVGAYVFIVVTLLVALWTVGRKLRREKRLSRRPADVEMIQPPYAFQFAADLSDAYPDHFLAQNQDQDFAQKQIYHSPITPISPGTAAKNFSWPSPEKTDRNPYIFPTTNSAISPVASDPSVDLQVVQADRENLHRGLEDIYAHVMAQEEAKAAGVELPPPPMPIYRASQSSLPSVAPQRLSKKSDKSRPTTLDVEGSKKPQSRASSFISSLKSPRKKNTRELQISSPIPTPLSSTFPTNYASDEEPLSPRYYSPPPPPPAPNGQDQSGFPYSHSRNNSNDPSPVSPARSIAEQLSAVRLSNNQPQPFQHRMNQHSQSSIQTATSNTNRQIPAPIQTQPARNPLANNPLPALKTGVNQNSTAGSANASTRTLPFRAFDPPAGLSSPTFSQMTKTTVLERTTPLSPGMRTPFTAGAVPYSPYQPQTPLIPVTPRLVTKEDRKRMKRHEKRAPVMELIKSDDEMWDSGY